MWNVWVRGEIVNKHPLNENQARNMAFLLWLNYGCKAKAVQAVKAWKK